MVRAKARNCGPDAAHAPALRDRIVENGTPSRQSWSRRDSFAAAGLFTATAAVILWQNAHLAVLWDLSYVLDSAARIAIGQLPYRDFPLAHAPLTFLIQAAIIRLTGRVFFHHVLYAAAVGGLSTVLAWRIALHTQRERVAAAWAVALLLAAPLTVLGIYCILPLPSYDCDCAFSILVAIRLLQRLTPDAGDAFSPGKAGELLRSFAAGAALCAPLFFKQNIGLPFLAVSLAAILVLLGTRFIRRGEATSPTPEAPTLIAVLAGAVTALLVAALLLHFTVGLGNYFHWTIRFAAQRRLPGFHEMLGVYLDPSLLWKLPSVVAGLFLLRSPLRKMRWGQVTGLVLLAAPFLFTLCSLLLYDDADERGDSLLALWPLLLILAAVLALFNLFRLRRDLSLRPLLPIVLLVAINGTLMSQQLWGSTYAIWPLLILLIVEMIGFLAWLTSSGASPGGTPLRTAKEGEKRSSVAKACVDFAGFMRGLKPPPPSVLGLSAACLGMAPVMAAVISATLLVCGGFYTASEERLSYVQLPEGPVEHSTFPQLAGMAVPGEYLPDFDELLRFAEANIPFSDGLILMPGEDPFYFVTGRVPEFPVLLFDPTTDPYSPAQVVEEARLHRIRWLIVKRELQIKEDPAPQREATLKALLQDFTLSARLHGYDVYRRR
jgi:hypothetical protein